MTHLYSAVDTSTLFGVFRKSLLATCAAAALCGPAFAQTAWQGGISTNWFDPSNWSAGVPTYDLDVIINGGAPGPLVVQTLLPSSGRTYLEGNTIYVGDGIGNSGFLTLIQNHADDYSNGRINISAGEFVVGKNGGSGTLTIQQSQSNAQEDLLSIEAPMFVGQGAGSVGVVNLIGSGKSNVIEDFAAVESGLLAVGVNGGSGAVTINGGFWTIMDDGYDSTAVPEGRGLSVGFGPGGKGAVDVLGGGKLSVAPESWTVEAYASIIGEDGGVGVVTVSGSRDPDARAAAFVGRQVTGSGVASPAVLNALSDGKSGNPSAIGLMAGIMVGDGAGSDGTLNVLSGGKAFVGEDHWNDETVRPFIVGNNGGRGTVRVSGAGSMLLVSGSIPFVEEEDENDISNATTGDLYIGKNGNGRLIIADQGRVTVGTMVMHFDYDNFNNNRIEILNDNGVVFLAEGASSSGLLAIGGAPGEAAAAPGALEAAGIVMMGGDATVAFNHTSSDYTFALPISGAGQISVYSGTTWITNDNRNGFSRTRQIHDQDTGYAVDKTDVYAAGFSGRTSLYGGVLGLGNDGALGSSSVTAYGDSTLLYGAVAGSGVSIANAVAVQGGVTLNLGVAAGLNASQSGAIAGEGSINKMDAGTLALTAFNTLSGEVRVSAGTLALAGAGQVSMASRVVANSAFDISAALNGAAIRSLAGSGTVLLGNQALAITAASDLFSGTISGGGSVSVTGGVQRLSGPNTYSGTTIVGPGATLQAAAGSTFSAMSGHTVQAGGALDLAGFSQAVNSLSNAGTVMTNGAPGAILSVISDYTGYGGTFRINTVLAGSDAVTDRMVIAGSSSGITNLVVTNVGGHGAQTIGNGIQVVQVAGASPGIFMLGQRTAVGAYEYTLHQGGGVTSDGSWYLRSTYDGAEPGPGPAPGPGPGPGPAPGPGPGPGPAPGPGPGPGPQLPNYRVEVPLATSVPVLASQFATMMLGTYHDRSGGQDMAPGASRGAGWARVFGGFGDKGDRGGSPSQQLSRFLNHGAAMGTSIGGFQAGVDVYRKKGADGSSTTLGFYTGGGRAKGNVGAIYGGDAGHIDGNYYAAGIYGTHVGATGWYVDAVGQFAWSNDEKAQSVRGVSYKISNTITTASLEAGYPVALGGGWIVEPQAQLIYHNIKTDDVVDRYGWTRYGDINAGLSRVGVRVANHWTDAQGRKTQWWARANIWHQFGDNVSVEFRSLADMPGVRFSPGLGGTWGQISVGASGVVSDNVSVFASADYEKTFDGLGQQRFSGRAGLRISW